MDNKAKKAKEFPDGKIPLGKTSFRFACHPGLKCFNFCCRKLEMYLYPYDIARLKNRLGVDSEDFMNRYTRLGQSTHPYFPAVMMRMTDNKEQTCPFLGPQGCIVYDDRPSACRTYPLERAVDRTPSKGRPQEFFFLTDHPYCLGHREEKRWTVKEWLRDQQLLEYNVNNNLWSEVDTLFSQNPWHGEGVAGPRQQMAFMVCYNVDRFRRFVNENGLLSQFKLDHTRTKLIRRHDEDLLKFGFDWLKYVLAGMPTLQPKR